MLTSQPSTTTVTAPVLPNINLIRKILPHFEASAIECWFTTLPSNCTDLLRIERQVSTKGKVLCRRLKAVVVVLRSFLHLLFVGKLFSRDILQ